MSRRATFGLNAKSCPVTVSHGYYDLSFERENCRVQKACHIVFAVGYVGQHRVHSGKEAKQRCGD